MPVESIGKSGGTIITGNAVLGMRGLMVLQGLRMYERTGGRMVLTRGATPKVLREIAGEFTGKTYARSKKGMAQALADMETLFAKKSLDEVGETRAVNLEVGGVAADLDDRRNDNNEAPYGQD
jgi:hypothetical protein